MRRVENPQLALGQTGIDLIELDLKSRDDIPHILLGLQQIYTSPALRQEVFTILEQIVPRQAVAEGGERVVATDRGRPGMEQWKILVLGVLRLGLNTDYDRIHELANHHQTIRQFLGHSDWADETRYSLQTIKDNLKLVTPEVLDQINQAVVRAGHSLVKKSLNDGPTAHELPLDARCDSFVVKTHIHFPTDLNLLWDALRKTIQASQRLAEQCGVSGWRQHRHLTRKSKQLYRAVQKAKDRRDRARLEKRRSEAEERLQSACYGYLNHALEILQRSRETLRQASATSPIEAMLLARQLAKLEDWQNYIDRFQDQIYRRLCLQKSIPHDEKVFSIFQPHSEWISKGKAGVPVELGLRVAILEDQHQFILHHRVMQQETDDKVAIPMAEAAKARFPNLRGLSYDKGFHSPHNQQRLPQIAPHIALPKKGRLSEAEQEREASETFRNQRRRHSAVESAINALEQCGLDLCRDHGIIGFQRYVALAVLSRNIKRLGQVIRQQTLAEEVKQRERERRRKIAA
jgi:IS5 family transposase